MPEQSPPDHGGVAGVGRSALWRYANLIVTALGGLFVTTIALRKLGPGGYGVFAIAAATIALVGTVDFGLTLSVMRSVARDNPAFSAEDRRTAREDASTAHSAYGLFGAATLVVTAVIFFLLPVVVRQGSSIGQERLTVLLVGVAVALSLGTSAFDGVPSGRSNFAVPAVAAVAGVTVNVAVVLVTIEPWGIVALGVGQLVGVVATRLVEAVWLARHEPWFSLWPRRSTKQQIRRVAVFAGPLLILSVGGQVVGATDLLVVGGFVSATAVAFYRVGSMAPSQALSFLFTGSDAAFPALAGESSDGAQERAVIFITKLLSYVAGVIFVALILLRVDVVTVIAGQSSTLATSVLVVFCCVWMANVPIHGLALLLIARGRQRSFVFVVAGEAVANIVLTIVFVAAFGALGAAVATFITLFVSDNLVLPYLVRHEVTLSPFKLIWTQSAPLMAIGGAVALVGVLPLHSMAPGILRLAMATCLIALLGLIAGCLLLGPRGRLQLARLLRSAGPGRQQPAEPPDPS